MIDAELQVTWTRALSPLDRDDLDTTEGRKSAYEDLSLAFNDRSGRRCQNACVIYENGEQINPYQAVAGMESIAQTCFDLDLNDDKRPERDGTWVEKQSKEIWGVMSKAYQNYRRSGNQDAESIYSDWCGFVANVSDVYKYCFIMPSGYLDQLGRALPDEVQRDTGRRPPSAVFYDTWC